MKLSEVVALTSLAGWTRAILEKSAACLPVVARPGEPLENALVDHIALVLVSREELTAEWRRLVPLGRIIEYPHEWPTEAPGCPEVPLSDKKYIASVTMQGVSIVLLAPFSPGDLIDTFLVNNGARGIHHVAFTVGDIRSTIGDLAKRFPSIRRVTALAEDSGSMAQIFFKLDPEIQFVELVQREGDFDGTLTCNNVRAVPERTNGNRN